MSMSDAMILKAARVLANRSASASWADRDQNVTAGGDPFVEDAKAMLEAVGATDLLAALQSIVDFPADFFDREPNETVTIGVTGRHLIEARTAIYRATGG